jgi:hypothetical protein
MVKALKDEPSDEDGDGFLEEEYEEDVDNYEDDDYQN